MNCKKDYRSYFLLLVLAWLPTSIVPAISAQVETKRAISSTVEYPNELPGYRFHDGAKWKSIKPFISTMPDVRRVLGEPSEANDLAAYTKPYPGDLLAKKPVFTYELDSEWKLLVYFNKYCFQGYEFEIPESFDNTVCSLDLIPKKSVPFKDMKFPEAFYSKPVSAIHGAWIEYADRSGLVYEVYTSPGPYSKLKAGDLNRIVYTASDKTFGEYSKK